MAVDDEPATLFLLKAQLEAQGCEVIDVCDSREASERLTKEKIDGLFLDVSMPHVDGFLLTQRARLSALNGRVPIVMLTGHTDGETMRKGFQVGANFFLGKPFTRERVRHLLSATRGVMLREQQRYARLAISTPVDCKWGTERANRFRCDSVNISEGGMKLASSGGLAIGQELEVTFTVPESLHVITARAKVVRESAGAIGIQFLNFNEGDEGALRDYISARLE
jgi:CheY-like chemotaxis protein